MEVCLPLPNRHPSATRGSALTLDGGDGGRTGGSTGARRAATLRAMSPEELAHCHAALGVAPGVTLDELERAFMKRNFSLIQGKAGAADPGLDAQRQALRAAYEKLSAHLRAQAASAERVVERAKPRLAPQHAPPPPPPPKTLLTPPKIERREPEEFALLAFDNWKVNAFVPPLLLGLVWLAQLTPLKLLLAGFHVWMHELGHATAAWLCGWRATPLPIGWTPVEPGHSHFVYFGLLLMFVLLFLAGLKERKVWPMLAAVALAALQFFMTWRLPEHRKEFWMVFGGVGGEFYLSTLCMLSFWVQLPEKFRWGACRYVCFLIGAAAFLNIWLHWRDVYRGIEEIPFGSIIHGEEDAGGDMNRLMDDFGWTKFRIRRTYWLLGWGCWAALGAMWLAFVLRLNRVVDWIAGMFGAGREAAAG